MSSKIRIKLGSVEIDYEGSEEFLKEEFSQLLGGVMQMYQQSGQPLQAVQAGSSEAMRPEGTPTFKGTTAFFASKLVCKSAAELLIAAAARLTLDAGEEDFSREDLLKEIKSARQYFKSNMVNNLSKNLDSLTSRGALNEISSGRYSLSATELEKVKASL